jgi:hypothetical protein
MRSDAKDFVARLLTRRPNLEASVKSRLAESRGLEGAEAGSAVNFALETIVSEQRPVFFASSDAGGAPAIDLVDATVRGEEARFLADELGRRQAVLSPLLNRVGRIDVDGLTGASFVGTGWIIDDGIVVTNRHVAEVIASRSASGYSFHLGAGRVPMSLHFSTGYLKTDRSPEISIPVASVLYIEPTGSDVDIAFLKLSVTAGAGTLSALPICVGAIGDATPLCVLGYPAKASPRLIPDQQLMFDLYRDAYDVKRVAPGYLAYQQADLVAHDCTTLGGNSGSALVVMETGEVAGLHFAGIYRTENHAVPASILRDYRERRRWTRPPVIETAPPVVTSPRPATTITVTITIDGADASVVSAGATATTSVEAVEKAAGAFLRHGPTAVIAARLGYPGEGSNPLIVAAVPQSRLAEAPAWPTSFAGVAVRYEAATLLEQIEARAFEEAAGDISYDDDARIGPEFSLNPLTEQMNVRAHVSPEYGFEVLQEFFAAADGPLTSAMYEIQGDRMAEMLDETLSRNVSMQLTADPKSKPRPIDPADDINPLTSEVSAKFAGWVEDHSFTYKIVPLGRRGLVASAYHIKVTVDNDRRFWLSSGNWKNRSSQPLVDEAMRRRATETDLPGNRDWHLIVENATLAKRLRHHIAQDFERSNDLRPELPEFETLVLVPAVGEAAPVRKPPSRVLPPLDVSGEFRVQPLLTPDRDGRAYADPMLDLIRSARTSLLFQIPYIGMRRDPLLHRGIIDELIDALVEKLTRLDNAKVLLRWGNDEFSDNRHVSWYFQSRGVPADRLRQIVGHHTKGMVVDGQRVMIGSHNWSSQGVSVNRDASLIFNEPRLAGYFGEAFDIDWERSTPVAARRFVPRMPELVAGVPEAAAVPAGFVLKPLSEVLSDVDD